MRRVWSAFLQMLAVTSTTDGQCPIHIPSPFLCRLTMTSKWFAWVGWVWAWAGQKFKEWHPLGSDLKQMTDGSWWIKPPASSPQPYWSTQFSSVLSGNSLDNKPFIYFWLLSFSPCVSWEYLLKTTSSRILASGSAAAIKTVWMSIFDSGTWMFVI